MDHKNSTKGKKSQDLRDEVEALAKQNLFPMALCSSSHNCNSPGKQPHRKQWTQHPLGDLVKWLDNDLDRFGWEGNIGLLCGDFNQITVIDIDSEKAVDYFSQNYTAEVKPPCVRTGGGGLHAYYQYNPNLESSDIIIDGHKFEIKNDGRQVVCPPSWHYTDRRYEWIRPFDRKTLPEIPEAFLHDVQATQQRKATKKASEFQAHRQDKAHPNELYNDSDHYMSVLEGIGWVQGETVGENQHWCRPGKSNGVSATFHVGLRVFYCFTSQSTHFDQYRGYLPFTLLAVVQFNDDRRATSAFIRNLFGFRIEEPKEWETIHEQPDDEKEASVHVDEDRIQREKVEDNLYPFEIRKYIPDNSLFLSLYSQTFQYITDAPMQFGFFGAMGALSMACRNSFISMGANDIRPNIWLCFVAPSAVYRKTTSLNMIRRLVTTFHPELELSELVSKEKLIATLAGEDSEDAQDAAGFFNWSELAGPLRAFERKSYLSDMAQFLTDLFDNPQRVGKAGIAAGKVTADNPFLNIYSASTIQWLNECLSKSNTMGGFIPRFLWIFAQRRERQEFKAFPPAYTEEMRSDLSSLLETAYQRFSGGGAQFLLTEDAHGIYKEYVTQLDVLALNATENEGVLSAFYTRLQSYALKFAMLYQIDCQITGEEVDSGQRVITDSAMECATTLAKYLQHNIVHVVGRMTVDEEHRQRLVVIDLIKEQPGLAQSTLLRRSGLSGKRFDEVIMTLLRSDMIVKETKKEGRGRPTTGYFPLREKTESEKS